MLPVFPGLSAFIEQDAPHGNHDRGINAQLSADAFEIAPQIVWSDAGFRRASQQSAFKRRIPFRSIL